jgi:hypothetical protein
MWMAVVEAMILMMMLMMMPESFLSKAHQSSCPSRPATSAA